MESSVHDSAILCYLAGAERIAALDDVYYASCIEVEATEVKKEEQKQNG